MRKLIVVYDWSTWGTDEGERMRRSSILALWSRDPKLQMLLAQTILREAQNSVTTSRQAIKGMICQKLVKWDQMEHSQRYLFSCPFNKNIQNYRLPLNFTRLNPLFLSSSSFPNDWEEVRLREELPGKKRPGSQPIKRRSSLGHPSFATFSLSKGKNHQH